MSTELRETGISVVGDMPWGTHFCHFYETEEDLLDILIPYFKTGLENNEFCMWVVFDPINEEEARSALRRAFPEDDRYLAAGQIEIVPHTEWYLKDGTLDLERVCRWLLMVHDRGMSDELPLTHEAISRVLRVRRMGVTEVAGILQKKRLISYQYWQITILDREGLEKTACECYQIIKDGFTHLLK